ncbi:SGNH/GDSL hydrolase family protein [Nocardioides sp.]|uniref:SGNH/GDSL hydrolase family protein n=1 Tax=Nocardioides sp. TaxID=35761 RepID=UPI002D8001C9|nr:SGNH/GDSL hydrolase family protein [Nocardioides sp.]HET8961756.1 SGNH/GDSL hydrolase family protein [Nocardioides sp.]
MRTRTAGALVVAAGVAATLVVVVGAGQPRTSSPAPSSQPVDYVALGDSFSAGPLVPDARSDPPGCFRSTNNYPAFLAGYLGVRSYRDVTCSGAGTRDLRRPQQLAFGQRTPPQVEALSAGTDLVTVGIGGNDFGLFGSIVETCVSLRDREPGGAPCRRAFTSRIDGRPVDIKARDARRIEDRVTLVLRAVTRRAPEADVYLVGYPRLLPERGRCAAVPFAAGDYAWGRRIERLLDTSLSGAAERTSATYVDLHTASRGHDACAGARAWLNGSQTFFGLAAGFHPFQQGMRGMAHEVYTAITGEHPPVDAAADPPPGSVVRNPR